MATPAAGSVVVDAGGTILSATAEVEQLFGHETGALSGQPLTLLLPDGIAPDGNADGKRRLLGRRKDGSDLLVDLGFEVISDHERLVVIAAAGAGPAEANDGDRSALEGQLAFERMLAQFSLQCIDLPEEHTPGAIQHVLETVGAWLSLDRCSFVRFGGEDAILDAVLWVRPGVSAPEGPLAPRDFPWTLDELRQGRTVAFANRDDVPDERDRAGYGRVRICSAVYVPLRAGGRVVGLVGFSLLTTPRVWAPEDVRRLEVVASVFSQVVARLEREEALRRAHSEVQHLKDQLQAENVYLRREERERVGVTRIVGQSPAVGRVMQQIQQVAPTDSTVLLLGETGTGKELFATQIHELSARRGRAMVRVNCAAIPATLIESELFGREKGAFTGALARQAGRFELAHHSTIFLDEIGDLPADVQVKLLRVLEERTVERLGSPRSITVDTRIIAATHRNLEQRVQEGTFREDLYYRLNVFPIHVPPLRERVEDIPLLVWRFVEEFSKAFGKRVDSIDKESLAALEQYHWPGNVREVRNTVERAMIVAAGRRLTIPLPHSSSPTPRRSTKLADVERDHIRAVLESTRWRIRGPGGASDRLGLKPTTLETRMAKLGIRRPKTA